MVKSAGYEYICLIRIDQPVHSPKPLAFTISLYTDVWAETLRRTVETESQEALMILSLNINKTFIPQSIYGTVHITSITYIDIYARFL